MKNRLRLVLYNNFRDMNDTRQRYPSRLYISRYRVAEVSEKLMPRRDGKEEQVAAAAPP
jgi:hypothetical protein